MKEKIYVYTKTNFKNLIKNTLSDFEVFFLSDDDLQSLEIKNSNIVFVIDKEIKISDKSIFLNNNIIYFFSKNIKKEINEKHDSTKFIYGPKKTFEFSDAVKASFFSNIYVFKDIKINNEKITNIKKNLSCNLTVLEKNILVQFFKIPKIKRKHFHQNIFNLKEDVETKTIESHLTRIRKKLLKIESEIQISSKEDVFYIEN